MENVLPPLLPEKVALLDGEEKPEEKGLNVEPGENDEPYGLSPLHCPSPEDT